MTDSDSDPIDSDDSEDERGTVQHAHPSPVRLKKPAGGPQWDCDYARARVCVCVCLCVSVCSELHDE